MPKGFPRGLGKSKVGNRSHNAHTTLTQRSHNAHTTLTHRTSTPPDVELARPPRPRFSFSPARPPPLARPGVRPPERVLPARAPPFASMRAQRRPLSRPGFRKCCQKCAGLSVLLQWAGVWNGFDSLHASRVAFLGEFLVLVSTSQLAGPSARLLTRRDIPCRLRPRSGRSRHRLPPTSRRALLARRSPSSNQAWPASAG
jgi:hypothetical protein